MVEKLDTIHSVNRPAPPAQEIPGTYNPPSGVAYYFTPSGEQVRKMSEYHVGVLGKVNYDIPVVHDPCTKNYPGVSTAGFGYMFLWFCPIHGHCYGFHLIAGGGRNEGTHFHLFSSTRRQSPRNYFVILPASYLNMHGTGSLNYLKTQDFGMTCFMFWVICVGGTSNLGG